MRPHYRVRTLTDRAEILPLLQQDRLYAAYAIGDLAEPLFAQCRWAAADGSTGPCALALVFSGFQTPSLFVMGENAGIEAILDSQAGLQTIHATVRAENVRAVSALYHISVERQMWRMAVTSATFQPVGHDQVVRLQLADLPAVNDLYAWGGPEFFTASQLAQGVYYAVMHNQRPVAVAGTHVVAPGYGIAAVGNVYTDPAYRNRGYATACTGAVTAELLAMGCSDVVLNVRQNNDPAIRAYSRLGFHVHCPYVETPGQRRSRLQRVIQRVVASPGSTSNQV